MTFAIYSYFGLCLVGEQVGVLLVLLLLLLLQVSHPDLLPHLPGLLILKFIFFFGWLEVAGAISNPWGTDPDDFQVCPKLKLFVAFQSPCLAFLQTEMEKILISGSIY